MRWRSLALGGWGFVALCVLWCGPALASAGGNCVAYARELTGIRLDGNAASWWPHAEGRYARGHTPVIGAVLVFKPYGRMRVGHVAVVTRVVGPREVLVDQANWVRGRVTKAMSVVDASPLNDWTSVKVQFAGTHGRENPTYGFIYPHVLPADFAAASVAPAHDRRHPARAAHLARVAAHPHHPATGHGEIETARADPPTAVHRVAAKEHAHHQPKAKDVRLAYVYY